MSIVFNGTTIKKVIVNEQQIKKAIANGVTVFNSIPDFLYKDGDQNTEITGGYSITKNDSSQAVIGANYMQVGSTAYNNGLWAASYISTVKKIDLKNFTNIRFVGTVTSYANGGTGEHYSDGYLGISDNNNSDKFILKQNIQKSGDFDVSINVSDYDGEYYIVIGSMAYGRTPNYITMRVTKILVE